MRTTRSATQRFQAAKELQAETQPKTSRVTRSRGLKRTTTEVEISVSATGQGTHIKWIRPTKGGASMTGVIRLQDQENLVPGSATLDDNGSGSFVDGRFVTPPPIQQATPAAPRKVVQRQDRIGNPGIMGIPAMNFVIDVPEDAGRNQIKKSVVKGYLQQQAGLKPWPSFPLSNTFIMYEEQSDDEENDEEQGTSSLASPFSESPTSTLQRRMLSPHGTHLIIPGTLDPIMESDNYEERGATPRRLSAPRALTPFPDVPMSSPQKTRGLGPCGTILIGEDGKAIKGGGSSTPRRLSAPRALTPFPDVPMSSPQKTRGLGPCGTILIGEDGKAIVPGLQPGY
ncbi:uncharacterized protein LACBIDRAFT_328477 [Laccaria bicolor S238N-H82]|uniref:Predicted protein n=1 Tax=Laccaria bicolor (strain S238N-H82 / ATCC MYA-4686) TaxID=486041 RepID=B0DEY6_LACBS|nr:uncharacterized protein LACBIDRAFT_328477 [Laccaria bicolor S238N-H82]EDR06628.1 predicted protein [Laccaria bicolor S238N-H82]|eukprot:XP_001882475.1 predicted protein [Laccaria bicolor S238N-H82]